MKEVREGRRERRMEGVDNLVFKFLFLICAIY